MFHQPKMMWSLRRHAPTHGSPGADGSGCGVEAERYEAGVKWALNYATGPLGFDPLVVDAGSDRDAMGARLLWSPVIPREAARSAAVLPVANRRVDVFPRNTHLQIGLQLLNQTYYNNLGLDTLKPKL